MGVGGSALAAMILQYNLHFYTVHLLFNGDVEVDEVNTIVELMHYNHIFI